MSEIPFPGNICQQTSYPFPCSCLSLTSTETPVFNQSIDPVYDLLRKAVDAGRRTGQPDKPFSSTADRNWSQVIGGLGILPASSSSSGHHVPRNRSSASSSGSSSAASAHLLSVLNSQPASSSGTDSCICTICSCCKVFDPFHVWLHCPRLGKLFPRSMFLHSHPHSYQSIFDG